MLSLSITQHFKVLLVVKQLFINLPTCDTIHNILLLIKGSFPSTWDPVQLNSQTSQRSDERCPPGKHSRLCTRGPPNQGVGFAPSEANTHSPALAAVTVPTYLRQTGTGLSSHLLSHQRVTLWNSCVLWGGNEKRHNIKLHLEKKPPNYIYLRYVKQIGSYISIKFILLHEGTIMIFHKRAPKSTANIWLTLANTKLHANWSMQK